MLWYVSFFILSSGYSNEFFNREAHVLQFWEFFFPHCFFDDSSLLLALFFLYKSYYSDVELLRMILSYFSLHSLFSYFLQGFFNFIFQTLSQFIYFCYHNFNFQEFLLIL